MITFVTNLRCNSNTNYKYSERTKYNVGKKMNKKVKDKLIAIFGVLVIISASIGIYLWNPYKKNEGNINGIEEFYNVEGHFSSLPNAISVSDSNPFFALITTPLAVHYDIDGKQEVLPFYVKNTTIPSRAIERAEEQIGISADFIIDNSFSAKAVSLSVAEKFWDSSEGVLIIKDDQSGYNLGVLATPLASYLSIPIVVVDKMDDYAKSVLKNLGVKKSIVCGDIKGYGRTLYLNNPDKIVNASIKLVREKFGKVDYITITNPVDTREPEVLDSTKYVINPVELLTVSSFQPGNYLKNWLLDSGEKGSAGGGTTLKVPKEKIGSFTIPEDYKYALVKFTGINLNPEHVDLFGDAVDFHIEEIPGSSTFSSPSSRDSYGKTVADSFYTENVLYDMGGKELDVSVTPQWVTLSKGKVKANIVVEKLSDPLYPMMKGLSSIAPYLTAYRKGITFGKPSFAFTADDDVLNEKGKTCPGVYTSRYNEELRGAINNHIYNQIHKPLNKLLANLADISVENLKELRMHYQEKPVYIALVGGPTVLPQYVYEAVVGYQGTESDIIYGDIDHEPGWSNLQNDTYTYYPYQENIVGRITGWDVQDASALVARTVFYDDIIQDMDEWKGKATVQAGWGVDFNKPKILYKIYELLSGGDTAHVAEGYEEPLKWPTGCTEIGTRALQDQCLEPLGFNVERLERYEASREGLSETAINNLKWDVGLFSKILFNKRLFTKFYGEDKVKGGEAQQSSNFIFINGHGAPDSLHLDNEGLFGLGWGYGILNYLLAHIGINVWQIMARLMGYGFSQSITVGDYNVRNVESMELGPSFIWFETCLVGRIAGRYPRNCLSQAYLHAGANAIVVATTPSNVAGGYIEPYTPGQSIIKDLLNYMKAKRDAEKGIYPKHHFGEKMFSDMLEEIKEKDATLGLALRNARNRYLPEDANWTMYWTPPLTSTGLFKNINLLKKQEYEKKPYLENKYVCYQQFQLYGDPAFNPYEPCNLG